MTNADLDELKAFHNAHGQLPFAADIPALIELARAGLEPSPVVATPAAKKGKAQVVASDNYVI